MVVRAVYTDALVTLRQSLLSKALEDAKKTALFLASKNNLEISNVVSVSDNSSLGSSLNEFRSIQYENYAMNKFEMTIDEQKEVSCRVNVTYRVETKDKK